MGKSNHIKKLEDLGNFTLMENWDKFYVDLKDDPFEWYADWPEFQELLTEELMLRRPLPGQVDNAFSTRILVPGCGNSRLSEHLYDAQFRNIMNIDFSKEVIGRMLRRNGLERREMFWRPMNMTSMKVIFGNF